MSIHFHSGQEITREHLERIARSHMPDALAVPVTIEQANEVDHLRLVVTYLGGRRAIIEVPCMYQTEGDNN